MPGRRMRTSEPNNIHSCAQFGDLSGLQKHLEENPALLNAKNGIMAQTPLHLAAGYNKCDIIKYLLEWRGPVKVEMEAKNMYGETPLHMAAKNGCNESARLLISNGASLEAKANNGMTALHLAIWHARQAMECGIVKTLLEYNADCSIQDNEGFTPLNHISEGHGSEKLRELLDQHIKEQLKFKALKACGEAKAKMVQFEVSLSNIVGLHSLKLQLRKWAKGMIFDEKRRALGLSISATKVPHMAFLGNPGTGKTMVARVLGKLLHMVGVLPTDKVTEVQRTDLVGEFVGHTGPKTRKKLQEAEGGILFVDEAYRLIPAQKSEDKDYGLEALEEIMSVMDNGKIVVVFAGYREPMKRVIASNEGFCRRVTKFFHFDDFTPAELAQILHLKMNFQEQNSSLYGFKLHPFCTIEAVAALILNGTTDKQRKEMNGGLIDPLLTNARENLDLRLDFDCFDSDSLVTITMEDLEEGLRTLCR
ncbi:uncharacterized protein LOC110039180 isoform X1 [Phalaenopsis equestris]|uniref:uncharacterized protein LOC110039180 isoform X1 n=1 Tax=Phalaenopsis equestris TaxID=78828 RepID=UPI0009E53D43|nr:uncharacterized protein LOC110039180 isoform X1 [Phalaenopsis equestris]XP_020599819.1 uncharacterized protein LOC110039180 isoform X1 [Phalaenopsis equestris]